MPRLSFQSGSKPRLGKRKRIPDLRIQLTMFKELITCEGIISNQTEQKVRFRQEWNDCWVKRSDIEKLEILGNTPEGDKYARITVPESVADLLELQGVLE